MLCSISSSGSSGIICHACGSLMLVDRQCRIFSYYSSTSAWVARRTQSRSDYNAIITLEKALLDQITISTETIPPTLDPGLKHDHNVLVMQMFGLN